MSYELRDVLFVLVGAGVITTLMVGVGLLLARKEAREAATMTPRVNEMPERLRRAS
jgi:hypothetical protein